MDELVNLLFKGIGEIMFRVIVVVGAIALVVGGAIGYFAH